jgi:hypothetical protein
MNRSPLVRAIVRIDVFNDLEDLLSIALIFRDGLPRRDKESQEYYLAIQFRMFSFMPPGGPPHLNMI